MKSKNKSNRALASGYPKIQSILVNNTNSIANCERLLGRKQHIQGKADRRKPLGCLVK